MPIAFVDVDENRGRIHDDFAVEYDGPEQVDAYVNEVTRSVASHEQAVESILFDIVHDLDIKEVRREPSAATIRSD